MTISSETVKQVFTGNGVTTSFAIPFTYSTSSEVKVYLRDEGVTPATETLKTITTHYTISGGNVVMITAPAADEKLIIIRDTTNSQVFDPLSSAQLDGDSLELQLDKIVRMTQDNQEALTRAPLFPKGAGVSGIAFPEPVADDFIKWNAAGTALENSSGGTLNVPDLTVVDTLTISSLATSAPVRTDGSSQLTTGSTSLSSEVTGTLPIGNGGTGQTTQTAAMDALSPTTTKGDLLVDNGSNVIRVGVGSNGQLLTADSAQASGVAWETPSFSLTSEVTGTLPIANGGTGQTSQTAAFDALAPTTTKGDVIVHNGTDNVRLSIGTNGQVLKANSLVAEGVEWGTNTTVSPLTTKGDVLTYDTADARLPVGTNGQILTADSAETLGIKWAAPAVTTSLTTKGDIQTFDTANARIGVGTNGQVLTADSAEVTGLKWVTPSAAGITNLTGDVTGTGPGSTATTIANSAVTNAKMANMAQSTIKGRQAGGGTGAPEDLTAAQATAILDNFVGDSGSGGTKGLVPAPSAGDAAASKFLKANGTWTTVSGGGGGSSVVWTADSGAAPLQETKYNNKCWVFEDGLTQTLYTTVRVPSSYISGTQVFLKLNHFHEAASATQLLSAVTTLIESGDAFDDVTDQYSSTNTAQTAASKVIASANIDLTNASGQINSNSIAAGDLLKVALSRGTDTSTSDLFFIEASVEVTFS